jgi:tRNA A-37 threonylcarbamoyl transferase component Bud32
VAAPDALEQVVRDAFADAEVELLGCGGFACTFRVRDGARDLAVKALDPDKVEARAGREARALERVDSQYVAKLVDVGEVERDERVFPYIVMEYAAGRTLTAVLDEHEGPLPLGQVIELATKLSIGLRAIWEAGLVHRDLKPGNVLLLDDGDPVIVDLGIARHLDLETVTVPPSPGSPGWMAPEQVDLDHPERGDWRSDQFSFGLLLYVLATGYYPYRGTRFELYFAPREQDVRRPESVNPSMPAELAAVIRRLMAREPFERYLRPEQITDDLERAREALAVGVSAAPNLANSFYLAQGHLKSFATADFYVTLAADGVVCDARNMGGRRDEYIDQARAADSAAILDPVSYYDRSPQDARPQGYRDLGYGDSADPIVGFTDDGERNAYLQPIVDYQREAATTVIVAPYFYAARGEASWIDESLAMARLGADYLAGQNDERPVWTAVAVAQDYLRPHNRNALLNRLTSRLPTTLYLLVSTSQQSFGPLGDAEVLKGMQIVSETLAEAEVSVVFGRRASEGLLLLALGAAGYSTGVSAVHQNFQPHPEAPDPGGGQGSDWYYVPRFLNTIKIETRRDIVADGHPELVDCNCPFCAELFATNAQTTIADGDERILLLQHNIFAQRRQAARLASLSALDRLQRMRRWIEEALHAYGQLAPTWAAGEGPEFLRAWQTLL